MLFVIPRQGARTLTSNILVSTQTTQKGLKPNLRHYSK